MRLKILTIVASSVTAIVSTASAFGDSHKNGEHVRGCNTTSCDKRIGRRWWRKHRPSTPMSSATASWYGPGLYGQPLACGGTLEPGTAGVANKTLPCGTRLRICVQRCLTTSVIDRGPYVAGREFDLTAPVKNAIGAGPLATVRYRIVG